MARTRKRTLYALVEPSYATEPSATGASYLWIPADEVGDLSDDLELLPTDYFTGRDRSTTPIPGPDGASFTFSTPFIGLATAAGDDVNASTVTADWLDTLALHTFGQLVTTPGESITATTATSISTTTVDPWDAGHVVPVFEAGYPSAGERSTWQLVTGQNGSFTYDVVPGFADTGPGAGGVGYGAKIYRPTDTGGITLAFVYVEDDVQYTMLGCRITGLTITGQAGRKLRMNWSVRAERKTVTSKASLPVPGIGPAITPAKLAMSPVWFGTTNLGDVGELEIDFALTTAVIESVNGTPSGRAGDQLINLRPTVTVDPLRLSSSFDLKRNATADELMVSLGRGQLSGGVLNTGCVNFPLATAREVSIKDGNGHVRNLIRFQADDAGATWPYCQLARA